MKSDPDPRRQKYAPYARRLADLMGLKDWTVEIDNDPPYNEGALASANVCDGRKYILIDLGTKFLTDTPESQRHMLTHELIHAHLGQMNEVLGKMLTGDQYAIHRVNMEYVTDGIAVAWAEMLPLPDQLEDTCHDSDRIADLVASRRGPRSAPADG